MGFFDKLKDGVFTELLKRFSEAAPKILFALLILLIGWLIASGIRRLIRRVLASLQVDRLAERLNDIDIVQRSGMRIQIDLKREAIEKYRTATPDEPASSEGLSAFTEIGF